MHSLLRKAKALWCKDQGLDETSVVLRFGAVDLQDDVTATSMGWQLGSTFKLRALVPGWAYHSASSDDESVALDDQLAGGEDVLTEFLQRLPAQSVGVEGGSTNSCG